MSAYDLGRILGVFLFVLIVPASLIGYTFTIWKFGKSGQKSWLLASGCLGFPVFGLVLLVIAGAVYGAFYSKSNPPRVKDSAPGEPVEMLKEKFETLKGVDFDYSVELPDFPRWKMHERTGSMDRMFSHRDLYFGIVYERIGMGNTDSLRQTVEARMSDFRDYSIKKAKNMTIAGLPWQVVDIEVTADGIKLKYRYYLFADSRRTVQILAWSSPAIFDENAFLADQIAQSFRFPAEE
jgi:hypothetical protein